MPLGFPGARAPLAFHPSLLRPLPMPLAGFPPETFRARQTTLLERLGEDAMVLPAAPRLYRNGDSELPYRPDSELFWASGWTEPEALLLLRGFADEARVVLWVAPRDAKAEQWTGVRLGPEGAGERLGLDDVRSLERLPGELAGLLEGAERIHFRLGEGPATGRGVQGVAARAVLEALGGGRRRRARTGRGTMALVDPGLLLDELRLRKDPEEVDALREACALTLAGFEAVARALAGGAGRESQVEAELVAGFRRAGATGPAFAPIVAAGRNSCILHYDRNDGAIVPGDLLLVDAGAEHRLFAGDVTRTFPVTGRFSGEQRALYQVVEEARAAGVAAVRPGATMEEVHGATALALARGLVELGVLKGDAEARVEEGALSPWFPHRTSHWLGLETHDPGDTMVGGRSRVLEPGMVLTVEPGLYISPPGLFQGAPGEKDAPMDEGGGRGDPAAPFRGLGIRIEDDILVTPGGHENLTAAFPTDPDALEELLARLSEPGRG